MPLIPAEGDRPEYYLLCYDKEGREQQEKDGRYLSHQIAKLLGDATQGITDVFVMSHGWKGDVPAARAQYDDWSTAMAKCTSDRERARAKWPGFKALSIGFHWPSQPWGDEKMPDGSYSAEPIGGEDQFVEMWSDRIADSESARAALRTLFAQAQLDIEPDVLPTEVLEAYRTLERESGLKAEGLSAAPDADREPLDPQVAYEDWRDIDETMSYSGGFMGGLLSPLRQLSFWMMKRRAKLVGEVGGHQLLRRIAEARPAIRIHLMGHSFGCIVTSGMLRGEDGAGRTVSSVILVQGAMSLWSYAGKLPSQPNETGYFRPIVDRGCVRGPIVVTTSRFDRAVGMLYPKAAGLRRQVAYDARVTDKPEDLPKYGAIGTFGLRGDGLPVETRSISTSLTHDYGFAPGHVYNVNADAVIKTGGGLSGAHSDIGHPEVGHVFWEAVLATPGS